MKKHLRTSTRQLLVGSFYLMALSFYMLIMQIMQIRLGINKLPVYISATLVLCSKIDGERTKTNSHCRKSRWCRRQFHSVDAAIFQHGTEARSATTKCCGKVSNNLLFLWLTEWLLGWRRAASLTTEAWRRPSRRLQPPSGEQCHEMCSKLNWIRVTYKLCKVRIAKYLGA